MATKPKPKPYQFTKPLERAPQKGFQDPVKKGLEFFFGDKIQPSRKKNAPKPRGVKLPGTPVPLAKYKPSRAPGAPKPVPMPKRVPNLSLPPDQRAKAKPTRPGLKKKSPSVVARPKAKKKM
jgi:hypothetical protein